MDARSGESALSASAAAPGTAPSIYQDENSWGAGSSSSFAAMTQAFSQRIAELQQLVCFRVEDSVKHIFLRDIQGIEASTRALEQLFDELRERTQQEMSALPKARALLQAAHAQQQHLQQISANLPQHLPGTSTAAAQPALAAAAAGSSSSLVGVRAPSATAAASAGGGAAAAAARDDACGVAGVKAAPLADRRRRDAQAGAAAAPSAPRWYVTTAELASVPAYMRGRMTLEKVNAALEELAGFAEACARSMACVARNQMSRLPAEERARLHELYHALAVKEGVRGRPFFTEADLRSGSAVKLDKSGRGLLVILRHLGRLAEVRAVLEGGRSVTAFVLQPQLA